MIYTDGIHMVATTEQELHSFASRMGIGRHWYEGVEKGHPHYDLPSKRVAMVVGQPEVEVVNSRVIVVRAKCMVMNPKKALAYKRP